MHCNVDSDCYMPTTICEATRKVCLSVRLVTVLCRRQIPVIQVRYKTSADVLCPYS